MTNAEKNIIRNNWCDQLCAIFNFYYKNKKRIPIRTPMYTAKVLSYFGLVNESEINHNEKFNILSERRTKNEDLIYKAFDELIEQKAFIGDFLIEFRHEFNNQNMPF